MNAILVPQRAPAAPWSLRFAVFAAVLLAVSGAGHRFGLVETVPFFWLLGISGMLAFAGLALGVIALVQIWEHGSSGASVASAGILIAAIALAPYGVSALRLVGHPRLIDISTDLDHPPEMPFAVAARRGGMNAVATSISQEDRALQEAAYPEVAGRRYEHTADKVLEVVRSMMQDRGWQPRGPQGQQLAGGSSSLEGLAHSFFLGFPADVAIRIEDDQTATFVDMRSTSRYARHDLGDNAARIQRFLNELDERMALLAAI
ncbi:DUF1499 domain-containing protein [Nitratireductor kimnyeongensis]|uniref:DUF1499 domain-containing protein n=1 Tax=Nitratireductor kimnyeongensis TaxID=430679 RepID=A0ABW0T614_9HYPH|nr:DUF1499 domain-containing protein [Nitratireductor kimnyeongensis]QZZ34948.1 DUF1499 domain-containing protein [Nitratireductor kimnyeongensis]